MLRANASRANGVSFGVSANDTKLVPTEPFATIA